MPFGEIDRAEFGTYFIGYAATPEVTEQMLRNMFLSNPPGNTDLLDCSDRGMFFSPVLDSSTTGRGCPNPRRRRRRYPCLHPTGHYESAAWKKPCDEQSLPRISADHRISLG